MAGRRISIVVDSHGVNRVARDLSKLNTIGDRVSRTFKAITAQVAGFAKSLWQHKVMIAAAASGMAYAIFRPFSTLEYTMARVRVASGATVQQIATLNKLATQLGRDTLYSASQAAEGMLYLAKAGMDVQQIYEAIPGVLDAAIVEQLDLGTAADIVTGLLNEFKLSASQAGLAADVLAKGSNLAKTDMVQMSEALKMFGAVAHDMGYSIEESVAMLDVLAGSMIRGTMAGTALRTSMLTFQQLATGKMTGAARDTFKRLGLDVNKLLADIKAGKIDFLKFAALLRSTGATAGDLANIFEKRTAVAVLTLGDAVNKTFPKLVSALKDAAGYSAEAGKIMEHTLWGQIQQIKSSIETMTNAIAETFAPGIEDFLEHTMRPKINEITAAWQEGGNTWQEKLRYVWQSQLRPVMEQGLASLGDVIDKAIPVLSKAMGNLASQLVLPLTAGLARGIGDLFVKAIEGWRAGIDYALFTLSDMIISAFKTLGKKIEDFFVAFGKKIVDFFIDLGVRIRDAIYGFVNKIISGLNHLPFVNIPLVKITPAKPAVPEPSISQGIGLSGLPTLTDLLPGPKLSPQEIERLNKIVAPSTAAVPSDTVREVDALRQEIQDLRVATQANTDAVTENTNAKTESSFWSQAGKSLANWGTQLIQKGEEQFLGGIESVLLSTVTDPITGALETYLAPTMTKIEHLAGTVFHIFDPVMAIFNRGLDVLTDIFGGAPYEEGRYTGRGAYQYAYATGGVAVTPQIARLAEAGPEIVLPLNGRGVSGGALAINSAGVHVDTIEIYGTEGEEAGDAVVEELSRYEEITTRQLARSLQMGMLKREAIER